MEATSQCVDPPFPALSQMPPARQGHPHLKQETGGAFSGDVCLRRASRREAGWSPGSAWTLHTDLPVLPATWKDSQELLPLRGTKPCRSGGEPGAG